MNVCLDLPNKLKEYGKFFSHFTMDPDEECTAAIFIALLKKKKKTKKEEIKNSMG